MKLGARPKFLDTEPLPSEQDDSGWVHAHRFFSDVVLEVLTTLDQGRGCGEAPGGKR